LYVKDKNRIRFSGFRRPEYINIRNTVLLINPKRLLLRMLLVFLILPINMVFVILIQPSYGKGEEFLTNWNSKYQHEDVSLSTKWDIPM
jgi:hypothetical protein